MFRANIIIASSLARSSTTPADTSTNNTTDQAYAEDTWTSLRIQQSDAELGTTKPTTTLTTLGPCRRCQMVTIDQATSLREAQGEPFATLAKTRRWDGKVWFGVHACLEGKDVVGSVKVSDRVVVDIASDAEQG